MNITSYAGGSVGGSQTSGSMLGLSIASNGRLGSRRCCSSTGSAGARGGAWHQPVLPASLHGAHPRGLMHCTTRTAHCLQFVELHGDRGGLADPAMVCGLGSIDGVSFMFIGHQKGRNTKVGGGRQRACGAGCASLC